jgi:enhancing lycopene biosynthesis protein 2
MNIIINLSLNDNGAKLVANNPNKQQNEIIEGKTIPEVLCRYAGVLQRESELSKIAAKEYAKQELAKLTDLDVLIQHGNMSDLADRTKMYYGHDEHWAALFDALSAKLESMR